MMGQSRRRHRRDGTHGMGGCRWSRRARTLKNGMTRFWARSHQTNRTRSLGQIARGRKHGQVQHRQLSRPQGRPLGLHTPILRRAGRAGWRHTTLSPDYSCCQTRWQKPIRPSRRQTVLLHTRHRQGRQARHTQASLRYSGWLTTLRGSRGTRP